ncbi:AsmA family protein [Taklimakanibacter deserti]|uniref:AsmA family protein n=1 Tax=Taklimakanibacter deserti TaxID=2267839 RepID=UPI000E656D89
MRKLLLAILAVAAVVIVAAGILLTTRIRAVSADLAQRVERQTGMQVTSSGLPGISFWPRFSVSFGNVVIPAPKGFTSAPLATIETIRIMPADGLLGLGEAGIDEVVLERPNINLVVSADGRANWNYAAQPQAGEPPGLPVRIAEGRIAFLDERSGAAAQITNVESLASLAGPADEFNAKGSLVWNERRATFTLFLKSPQRVAEDGSPADLTLEAPGLAFQFSGRAALARGFELDGQSEIKGTDLGLAASWFGAALPSGLTGARFELAGAVETSNKGLAFNNTQFVLDDMRGEGDIAMALGKGRPMIEATVEAQTIDLTRYSGAAPSSAASFLTSPWSSKPIDLSALKTLDADLDVSAKAFAYGALRTGPARLTADLRDGKLDLKLAKAAYVEGTLDLALTVDGKAEQPTLQFSVNGENLAADKALLAAVGLGDVSGKLSPSLSVNATGRTLAELISTLKGQASVRIVSGAIKGVDLKAAFGKVANTILEGWGSDQRASTSFDALSATFIIADGIAETGNLILTSPALSFTGKGEADLLRQAIDLKVDPQLVVSGTDATAPQFATFPVAIQVKGPWGAPRIYPDMPGILEDPAAAYAALKKLGLGTSD